MFRQHYGAMYRQACRMLGNDAESRDVVSDVFAQLLDGSDDLRDETLRSYLLTLTRNRCINLLVRRQREKAAVMVDIWQEDEKEQEQLEALYRFIDERLAPLSQQVLRLRYQQGMKYREIAGELRVSVLLLSAVAYATIRIVSQPTAPHTAPEGASIVSPSGEESGEHQLSRGASVLDSTAMHPVVFEDAELQVIVREVAAFYKCEAVFRNEQVKHTKLYFTWDRTAGVDEVVATFNKFERFHVTYENGKMIVE